MLVLAKDYPNEFRSVKAELDASENKSWYPSIDDFRATAAGSGGSAGEVSTLDELIEFISKQKDGSIGDLGLIGHADRELFGLGGRIKSDGHLYFTQAGLVWDDTLTKKIAKIKAVRGKFAKDGTITLYACDAGSGKKLLDAISDAFGVKARGFSTEIFWCFMTSGNKAQRGRTYWDREGYGVHPSCDSGKFTADIRNWTPDTSSSSGVTP